MFHSNKDRNNGIYMNKKLLYSCFFITYSVIINASEDSLFGGSGSSADSGAAGLFGSSSSSSNITFGQPAQTVVLPKTVTAQVIAGSDTQSSQNQAALVKQAETLQLQTQIADQSAAFGVLQSKTATPEQKGVAMLSNHTDVNVSGEELASNPVTAGAQQVTFKNKKKPSPALQYLAQKGNLSFTAIHNQAKPFVPTDGITSNATLNQLYLDFINNIKNNSGFIPFFRKLHVVALHEIYNYLMGVYAALNITHIDDVETYVTLESIYGLNKKTLIVNHLINVIEAQLNQAIRGLFPTMPEQTASHSGMSAIELDELSKLDLFIVDIEQVVLATFKKSGITPETWNTVYTAIKNPDYQNFFNKLNQQSLSAALDKINYYYSTSMDLSGMAGVSEKTAYQKSIETVYSQAPQVTYFNGSIPSGKVWQTQINSLFQATQTVVAEQVPCSVSLMKQLTHDEKIVLIDALDLLVAHCASIQRQNDTASLITILSNANNTDVTLSYGQYRVLLNVVRPLALDGSINTCIQTIQKIQPLLLSGESNALSSADTQILQELLGFVCTLFENRTAANISSLLTPLLQQISKQINTLTSKQQLIYKQFSGLTVTQQALLQALANQLLTQQITVADISAEQQQVLADGFTFLSHTQEGAFSAATQSLFLEIAQAIEQAQQFSEAQQTAFTTGLTYFSNFVIKPYSLTQAEKDIYQLFEKSQVDAVTEGFQNAGSFEKKKEYIANLSVEDKLILLVAFQLSGQILESRYAQHVQSADNLLMVFGPEEVLKKQLYKATSYNEYTNLAQIYQIVATAQAGNGSFNVSSLSFDQRKDLYNYLAALVVPVKTFSGVQEQLSANNVGLLQLISNFYTKDPLTADLFSFATSQTQSMINAVYKMIRSVHFSYSSITNEQKQLLYQIVSAYQQALEKNPAAVITKVPSSQTATQGLAKPEHPLSIPEELALSEVLNLLHAATHAQQLQNNLKLSLGKYLNFFTPYTATLEIGSDQAATATTDSNYQGLTQFSNYAQSISQALSVTNLNNVNPPLFFYNAETLRLINLLPFLAESVEGTVSAPFPTLAVECATSTTPTADPNSATLGKNNQILSASNTPIQVPSLTVTVAGQTYSPRFFFKDANGNAFANGSATTVMPKWIQKEEAIPGASESNSSFMYVPAIDQQGMQVKTAGQEGLYMNIPMAHENPVAKGMAVIRLYEQKILAQPEWLNSKAGVITMLRVCLGDFASALTLQEPVFDACLELIFRQSLATLSAMPQGLPAGTTIDTSDALLKTLSQTCKLASIEKYLDAQQRAQAQEAGAINEQ